MVQNRNLAAAMLALIPLAACSSDHPIPPLDVGMSARLTRVAPANARLVEQDVVEPAMPVETAYPDPQPGQSISRIPLGAKSVPVISLAEEQDAQIATEDTWSYDDRRDPDAPTTLDAQAERIDRRPIADAPAAVSEPVSEDVASASPAAIQPGRIALSEVMGVGAGAAEPLATRFGARAKERGLNFVPSSDASAQYVMKGYFSTSEDDGQTYVVYVWDISDRDGNRVNRINGREPAGGSGAGWEAVTPEAMHAIADRTIDDMAAFVTGAG